MRLGVLRLLENMPRIQDRAPIVSREDGSDYSGFLQLQLITRNCVQLCIPIKGSLAL